MKEKESKTMELKDGTTVTVSPLKNKNTLLLIDALKDETKSDIKRAMDLLTFVSEKSCVSPKLTETEDEFKVGEYSLAVDEMMKLIEMITEVSVGDINDPKETAAKA